MSSTVIGGVTTRSSGRLTVSIAPALAHGRCTSKTASLPGKRNRPTTRALARIHRNTSLAGARAERHSVGTPTPPPECDSPTFVAFCSRCTARPSRGSAIPWMPSPRSRRIPRSASDTNQRAARAVSCARLGRRRWRSPPRLRSTRSRNMGQTASPDSRRFRPCRWHRTRSGRGTPACSAAA